MAEKRRRLRVLQCLTYVLVVVSACVNTTGLENARSTLEVVASVNEDAGEIV